MVLSIQLLLCYLCFLEVVYSPYIVLEFHRTESSLELGFPEISGMLF